MRMLLALSALILLAGCVGHYRYESAGTVQAASGEEHKALLYWFADDGRLWYGKPYKQVDTTVGMLVCGTPPKNFDGGDSGEPLVLKSRSGDRRVLAPDSQGQWIASPPEPQPVGSACGHVTVGGANVASDQLDEGATPTVLILCDNETRPDRYPQAGAYIFTDISRVKIGKDDERGAPDAYCSP